MDLHFGLGIPDTEIDVYGPVSKAPAAWENHDKVVAPRPPKSAAKVMEAVVGVVTFRFSRLGSIPPRGEVMAR